MTKGLTANGGSSPYSWSLVSGSLPPGLILSTGGGISGTPTVAGASTLTGRVTDSASSFANQALTIMITISGGLSIVTGSLPSGTVGVPYSQALTARNGITPYKAWAITAGSLPPGLLLSDLGGVLTGLLNGVPSKSGTFSFTIQVTDNANATATKQFSLIVSPGAGAISISTSGVVNAASYIGGSVSPGEIITIFGSRLTTAAMYQPFWRAPKSSSMEWRLLSFMRTPDRSAL